MKLFGEMGTLEILQGDCVDNLHVDVYEDGEITAFPGWTMRAIIADVREPETPVLVKNCSSKDGADFSLILSSDETEKLCGTYNIHIELYLNPQTRYKKLSGRLVVRPAAQGERIE